MKNKIILYAFSLIFSISCKTSDKIAETKSFRFAITGNTCAESPFKDPSYRLKLIFEKINSENPVIVIHTGDLIFGGHDWMGINSSDIIRQVSHFLRYKNSLNPILHTAAGDRDHYNSSPALYCKLLKCNRYYSFNYGSIHMVILYSSDGKEGNISEKQFKWLKKDLEGHSDSSTILVFMHHLSGKLKKKIDNGTMLNMNNSEYLHSILMAHPVKAVFSGTAPSFHQEKIDNIEYISAGCGGFNESDKYKRYNNYYIVDYSAGIIKITPQKIQYDH